jgi:hypothetical protein
MNHKIQINKRNGQITHAVSKNGGDYMPVQLIEYLELKRRQAIEEVRNLDRMLGRKQTIPEARGR